MTDVALLARVREQCPVTGRIAYMNTGTCGPLPQSTLEAMQATLAAEVQEGRIGTTRFADLEKTVLSPLRARLAALLNTEPERIALTNRTSDGLNIVLWGIAWQAGDEIITTQSEHPGLTVPLAAISRRYGVNVRYLDLAPLWEQGPDALLERLEALVTPRTRLIALSHVLWVNGAVLPLQAICAFARARRIRVLADGAQSTGAIPVDVKALGVDFYALPGQKWLCGPEGTGALYVAEDALGDVDLSFSGYMSVVAFDVCGPYFVPRPGTARFEVGMPLPAALVGFERSLAWLQDDVGLDRALERTQRSARTLRQRLAALDGVTVLSPDPKRWPLAGLVTFRIDGWDDAALAAHLERQGFWVRPLPALFGGVRVSTGFYVSDEQIDALIDALAELPDPAEVSDPS